MMEYFNVSVKSLWMCAWCDYTVGCTPSVAPPPQVKVHQVSSLIDVC